MTLIRVIGIAGLLLGVAAAPPAVAQGRGDHDTPATQAPSESGRWQYNPSECRTSADGWVMCRDRDGYWRRDHYDPDFGYGQGYGGGYGYDVLPPYAIVRNLQRNNFTYISQPVLAGQFYQVKALDPYGRKVKVYVDAYSGRIAKVK
jgi:hypothetical protein